MAAEERWYSTKEKLGNSPSRLCGIDPDKELSYRQQAANFIQDMGQRLQVTQLCINTAIVYMHRFYMFHSFSRFHRNSIASASLFLAAKVEEQPRKLEHVIKIAHMCLHRDQPNLDTKSEQYSEQSLDLVMNENVLLQTLGFSLAIDHPHTHVVKCCQLVRVLRTPVVTREDYKAQMNFLYNRKVRFSPEIFDEASKDLAQTSYFMATNSLHLTTMCLQYKPTVVACVCIHLACKWSNWEIPRSSEGKDWFWYVDRSVSLEQLEELTTEFLATFNKCPSRLKKKIMSIGATQGVSVSVTGHVPGSPGFSFSQEFPEMKKRTSNDGPDLLLGTVSRLQIDPKPGPSEETGKRRIEHSQKVDYREYKEKKDRERAEKERQERDRHERERKERERQERERKERERQDHDRQLHFGRDHSDSRLYEHNVHHKPVVGREQHVHANKDLGMHGDSLPKGRLDLDQRVEVDKHNIRENDERHRNHEMPVPGTAERGHVDGFRYRDPFTLSDLKLPASFVPLQDSRHSQDSKHQSVSTSHSDLKHKSCSVPRGVSDTRLKDHREKLDKVLPEKRKLVDVPDKKERPEHTGLEHKVSDHRTEQRRDRKVDGRTDQHHPNERVPEHRSQVRNDKHQQEQSHLRLIKLDHPNDKIVDPWERLDMKTDDRKDANLDSAQESLESGSWFLPSADLHWNSDHKSSATDVSEKDRNRHRMLPAGKQSNVLPSSLEAKDTSIQNGALAIAKNSRKPDHVSSKSDGDKEKIGKEREKNAVARHDLDGFTLGALTEGLDGADKSNHSGVKNAVGNLKPRLKNNYIVTPCKDTRHQPQQPGSAKRKRNPSDRAEGSSRGEKSMCVPSAPSTPNMSTPMPAQATNPVVTPTKTRKRTGSTSSNSGELVPVLTKLEDMPEFQSIRDGAMGIKLPGLVPDVIQPICDRKAGTEETEMKMLLLSKELQPPELIKPFREHEKIECGTSESTIATQSLATPMEIDCSSQNVQFSTLGGSAAQLMIESMEEDILAKTLEIQKLEKKKKKDKHKHKEKEKDKEKGKEERKHKHKHKDKDRSKDKDKLKERMKEMVSPIPTLDKLMETGQPKLKITIPKDKISVSGSGATMDCSISPSSHESPSIMGLKLKIVKERVKTSDLAENGTQGSSSSSNGSGGGLKIKISRDKISSFSSGKEEKVMGDKLHKQESSPLQCSGSSTGSSSSGDQVVVATPKLPRNMDNTSIHFSSTPRAELVNGLDRRNRHYPNQNKVGAARESHKHPQAQQPFRGQHPQSQRHNPRFSQQHPHPHPHQHLHPPRAMPPHGLMGAYPFPPQFYPYLPPGHMPGFAYGPGLSSGYFPHVPPPHYPMAFPPPPGDVGQFPSVGKENPPAPPLPAGPPPTIPPPPPPE